MIVKMIQNLEKKMELQINRLESRIEKMQQMFKKKEKVDCSFIENIDMSWTINVSLRNEGGKATHSYKSKSQRDIRTFQQCCLSLV